MDSEIKERSKLELAIEFYCAVLETKGLESSYVDSIRKHLKREMDLECSKPSTSSKVSFCSSHNPEDKGR